VPTVRVKVTLDDDGRAERAVVVDSSGNERSDRAVMREVYGKQFERPRREGRGSGGSRVAYATFAVASPENPRLLRAERRSR
jgi:TonB family protein